MAQHVDIIVPEDSQEGTETAVASWMKEVGDPVEKDEPLLELSTDKVNIEVAAPDSGRLHEILAKAGESVEPGQVLGRIALDAEASAAGDESSTGPSSGDGSTASDSSSPKGSSSTASVQGDRTGQSYAPSRSTEPRSGSDAQSATRSTIPGVPLEADGGHPAGSGPVGASSGSALDRQGHWGIQDRPEASAAQESRPGESGPTTSFSAGQAEEARQRLSKAERLSPAVRRLVKEHGLDISRIPGSGRGGRVTFADAQSFLQSRTERPEGPQRVAAGPGKTYSGRAATDGEEPVVVSRPDEGVGHRFVPHTTMRRKIASHMVKSMLGTAPHVTAVFEADLTQVAEHLAANRDDFLRRGAKLTYTAYLVDAAVQALQAVPEINSRWHDDGLEIFADCNIGIAAAIDGGLVVPVIRQAQSRSLFGLAQKLQDLTERARRGKLTEEDMRYGTFTITNHGVSGSLIATPIINQPQSAILGVGKIEKRVVVKETKHGDALLIRPMAYVTLTIDHRALDGFQANSFLSIFSQALQRW